MRRFTELFVALDTTNKTSEKVAAMERYFREAPARDAAWGLFFLSGLRLKRAVKTSVVWACALEASGFAEWILGECVEAVGDLSETISLLLPEPQGEHVDEPLHEVVERLIVPLVNSEDRAAREMLLRTWPRLRGAERLVFNKLIRGNFRVGVQRALVVRALAQATGIEAAVLAHRMSGTFQPTEAAFVALCAEGDSGDDQARPYPFCLAHQLDVPLAELGDVQDWQVEYKWDGTRAQIVRRGDGVAMWSRGEEPIAGQFPEISQAAMLLPAGTVLDGEVLAWRFDRHAERGGIQDGGRPLSFNALQARLNRKNVQPSLFDAEGVVFAAFDVLEHEGVDIRARPLRERRERLLALVEHIQPKSGGVIRLPPMVRAATWAEVEHIRAAARDDWGAEGLMLKHLDSPYHVGRTAGGTAASVANSGAATAGWWKWKVDPYAVDAVLIYAQQGSGRRAGLYTDYTFGVWAPAAPDGELTPFAKAYSGLNNDEIAKVDAFIRANTIGRTGPVRMVKPELVFEIAFEGIQESTRHRSGVAVRFPRIAHWRKDKKPEQADTIGMVRSLLEAARKRDAERGVSGA